MRAPRLSATLRTTRVAALTSTSVTGSAIPVRLGDREQMRLALGLGDVDEIGVGEPRRLLQHRPATEMSSSLASCAHQLDRCIADRRKLRWTIPRAPSASISAISRPNTSSNSRT